MTGPARRGVLSAMAAMAATWLAVAASGTGCAGATGGDREALTFNRDVAPIVFANCSPCHRTGEAGPFDLLDYDDVSKRADQIVLVTGSGYMPPWLPVRGHGSFAGERGLTEEEIDTIERWVEDGVVEGDPGDLPPLPTFPEGWQLGEPDLVLQMTEPFTVPAEGVDVIRNFIVPSSVEGTRWVRAVELRPGNKRVVHHAVIKADRTRLSRRYDALDPEPGFDGMEMGNAEDPDGHIIVWTPGMTPGRGDPDMAWRIDARTDLVLQLHLVPTGKPEEVNPRIGIHFAAAPPTRNPFKVMLREDRIDIPAGADDYVIEDELTIPVPVEVRAIYPHAHYLGRRMEAWADLPGGGRETLLLIDEWDFNWQGMYHYAEPVRLPAGSTLRMKYTYDNSAGNVRNPNIPPKRVVGGNRSEDEMGNLALQVLPASPTDLSRLREAQWLKMLADDPGSPSAHYNLGVEYATRKRYDLAAEHYRKTLAAQPDDDGAHYALGSTYVKLGDLARATEHFRRVTEITPDHAEAHLVLGWLWSRRDDGARAREHYERAIAVSPGFAEAHHALGELLESQGDVAEALRHYREALRLRPDLTRAREALARLTPP